MAVRRKVSAAPVKQRLRKNHGPKRHLHAGFKPLVHEFGRDGVLTKYGDYESFCLACAARGVKNFLKELWADFTLIGGKLGRKGQDEYLKNIQTYCSAMATKSAKQRRK